MAGRWMVVLGLIACRGSSSPHGTPDAPQVLDSVSDGVLDSLSGPAVTMTVQRDGGPDVGVVVVFQAADGTLLAMRNTGANGVASAVIPTGGIVTVFQTTPDVISTYIGVAAGESLSLTDYRMGEPTQTVDVMAPVDPNAQSYLFNHSCIPTVHDGGPVDFPLGCGSAEDVLVRAEQAGNYIGAIVGLDVPIVNHTLTITGTYMPMSSQTITVNSTVANAVGFSTSIAGTHGLMNFRNGGFSLTSGSGSETYAEGFVETGLMQSVEVTAEIPVTTARFHQRVDSIGPSSASFTLDLDALLLPNILDPPNYDLVAHKIDWTPTGGAQTPDAMFATISVANGTRTWQWQIAAPYTPGELSLPTLPVVVDDYNPQVGDNFGLVLDEIKIPGGYAAIRPTAFSIIHDWTVGDDFGFHVDPSAPSQTEFARWGY